MLLKQDNNQTGFTLIELEMVVAVIGILLFVFIPMYTGVKDAAKTVGVGSNLHVVHAQVQAIIENYEEDDGYQLEQDLATMVATLVNPITKESGEAVKISLFNSITDDVNSAVIYVDGDGDDEIEELLSNTYGLRGCVVVTAHDVDNYLEVKLTPLDANGKPTKPVIVVSNK